MSWISGGCVPEPTEPHVPIVKRELHGRTGYSVHVTYDVMGVESKEEAINAILDKVPEIEGVKIVQVHVGKYVISSLAAGLEDIL
jgi:predicted RNA-binding protein